MSILLEEGLAGLEELLREEARLVTRAVGEAAAALAARDPVRAEGVIDADDEIDALYLRLEEGVQALLARQTPVAVDLRRTLAMLHVNLHLERIGDYAVTIAKLARLSAGLPIDPELEAVFETAAAHAQEIVSAAVGAFFAADVEAARRLVELDEPIDAANRSVVRRVVQLGPDPARHEWAVLMVLVARCLERVGDHAVDIGEQTAYAATGAFHEFTDASHPLGGGLQAASP